MKNNKKYFLALIPPAFIIIVFLFLANFVPGAPDVSRIVKVLGIELATPAAIFFVVSYFMSLLAIKKCKNRPCLSAMIFVSISVSALIFVALMYAVWHLYFEQTIYLPRFRLNVH